MPNNEYLFGSERTKWYMLSTRFRKEHPHCLGCSAVGLIKRATVVDHIIPHRGDKKLFWDQNNWQACCEWHHNSIKRILELKWREGEMLEADLRLDSKQAINLTRMRYRRPIEANGYPTIE